MHLACDALGRPVRLIVTAGQAGDAPQAAALMAGLRPRAVVADRAYDADGVLAAVAALGAEAVIPPKRTRRVRRAYDEAAYAARNEVERLVGRLKRYRRVATRYDKTAASYLAFVELAAALEWLR